MYSNPVSIRGLSIIPRSAPRALPCRPLWALPCLALLAWTLAGGPIATWAQSPTNTVVGAISVPGEQDVWVFNVPTNQIFYFDALTNSGNLRWTLSGPPGELVSSRPFTSSDGQSINDPLLRLPTGDYRLTVDCANEATEGYGFRLVNLATASLIVPGTVVNGTLTPANETDFYQFSATAGDRFVFDQITRNNLPNCYWRLVDPHGVIQFFENFADVGTVATPITLLASGTYTVMVEGFIGNTGNGSYSFNVSPQGNVPIPPFTGEPLTIGSLVVSNLLANSTNAYVFTLGSAARLLFDSQTNSGNLNWTLEGPSGVVVNQPLINSSDNQNNNPLLPELPAGDYRLRVRSGSANPYRFRLLDITSAAAITPGNVVSNSLAPAVEIDLYRFTAVAGERFFFESLTSSGMPNAYWKLIHPYGGILFSHGFTTDVGPITLAAGGTYTLAIDGYFLESGSGNYSFRVMPVVDGSQALVLGAVTSGAIASPGQSQNYTFTLVAAARLHFDSLTNILRWSLTGPTGLIVNNRGFNSSDGLNFSYPLLNLPAGDYTLRVHGAGDDTGAYQFRLLDTAAATLLTPGTPVSATLNPAKETDLYAFDVATPGKYFVDWQAASGMGNAYQRLVDSRGNLLFTASVNSDTGPLNLSTGRHVFLIEGYHSDAGSGSYTFNILPVNDGSQALSLGTMVSGALTTPGQMQHYTFTLASAARLYFDSLTNLNVRWSLTGPTGLLVNNRGFTSSDGLNIGNPVLALSAGDYTLTVSAAGDTTGNYRFRLFDLATAAPMTPGTPVSSTLNPAIETDAYAFTLGANGKFFMDWQAFAGLGNTYARIVDSHGSILMTASVGSDVGPFNLAAGSYLMLIEGYIHDGGSGSYTFNLHAVSDGTQAATVGATVSGALTTPGQAQNYTFTLASAARLYFDSLTNINLRWSLTGPTGLLVNNRGFASSDSLNIGNPLLNLPPGNYTLTVSGAGDVVGAYQFRLFDLASATPMTPGTAVSGALNPANETDAYAFTIGSPGKYFYDWQTFAGIGNTYTRLVDSHGNIVLQTGLGSDFGPVTIAAGSYVLLVEGYVHDFGSGTYTINLHPVVDGTQALALDSAVSGAITTPGQLQRYTFTLGSATRLYFDSLTNTSTLRWSLAGPAGTLVNNRSFSSSDGINFGNPGIVAPAGSYTLTVSGSGDATGGYSFFLRDFAAATPLSLGPLVSANNFPANQTALYQFTAAAGDRFFFDHQSAIGLPNAYWRLIDPANNVIFFQPIGADAGTNTLAIAGTYVLAIEGYIGDSGQGSYSFNVRPEGNVPPVAFTGAPLTIGTVVGGSLPTAGSTSNYVFSLGTPARLYFDALTNANFRWSLRGPLGDVVSNRDFQNTDAVDAPSGLLALVAGNYQLTISSLAGAYQFRLLDTAAAAAFTPGTPVSNTLATARSTALYQFSANAGDRLFFDGRPTSGFSYQPWVRIFAPLDNVIMAEHVNTDVQAFTLLQSGTFILAVEGRIYDNNASGNYSFNLQPAANTTNTLTLGALVSGNITTVGQGHVYTFNLASPARVIFDALTFADFYWRLDAPWGEIVPWRSFFSSDGVDYPDATLALAAGSYTLTVAPNSFGFTGPYEFRLSDLVSATPFALGTVVSNTLAPGKSTLLYSFAANAGDKVYYDGRTSSGLVYQPQVRIYAPLGNKIFDQSMLADIDTFTLPQSGTYTVSVEGRIYDTSASGSFSFNLQPVTDVTNVVAIGALTTGNIATLGQRHYYNVNLASASRLYFDALTNLAFFWRLDAPWGEVVPWRSFQGSDSADFGNPMLNLAAGNYVMTVVAQSASFTGTYQFRLLDFAEAAVFTPGTVVSNTLSPSRSTLLYQFTGAAGQQVYFDGLGKVGLVYDPTVRIYGPLNNIILERTANQDADTFTLPQSGTYFVTAEGRIYDTSASGSFAFNLQPVAHVTNALTLGSTVSSAIITVGQRHYYTFNLPSAARLYFDSLTNADFYWKLDAHWGEITPFRSFQGSDSADGPNPLLALEAGNYVLTVAGNSFSLTGSYHFRMLDLAAASPFTPGTIVNDTLAPGRATVLYQFSATAGNRFYFDGRGSVGLNNPYMRLYAPLNNIVAEQYINSDVDTFAVPQSGTYVLTVEGRYFDASPSGTFSFNLAPNPPQPPQPLFETNNSPDLIVSAVSVSPASGLQSGDSATVHWTLENIGNQATAGSFTDRVTVRNTGTGQIIVNNTLAYNEGDPGNGPIAPAGTRARQLVITLPDGTNGVGNLEVTVNADTLNNVLELNSGGTAEANNGNSTTITTTLAPYPDLLVHSVTATPPSGWLPGALVTIQWRLTNAGPRAATNDWADTVVIRNTNTAYILSTSTNYIQSAPGNGALEPSGTRDRAITFAVPNNANAYGGFEITVTTDSSSSVFELNAGGSAETNNTRVAQFRNAPDLRVTGLGTTASPSAQSGASVTVNWNSLNDGNVDISGNFYDRVVVRNLDTTAVLHDNVVLYNSAIATNGPIVPGGSKPRSHTFTLPNGPAGAGNIEVTVTADTFNNWLELNAANTGEANNSTVVNFVSALAPYPDLRVVNLAVEPAALGGGTNLTVRWQDTNSGNIATANNWYDRVLIVNTNLGITLLDTVVFYNAGALGPLTNGTARDRSHNFTLPNNSNSAGGLVFTVTADHFDNIFEHNAANTGESNNAASITRFSSLTPLPDLAVHEIIAPSAGAPGQTVSLVYVVTNRGTATATGPWTDYIYLSSDLTVGGDYFLGSFGTPAISILAGGSLSRTQNVVVPVSGDAGNLHFVVILDAGNAVLEQTDSNNTLLDGDNFNVPMTLTVTLSLSEIAENALNPNISGTVTRNGDRSAALTVNLLSSDTSEIQVPASVVIGVGQVTANFTATVQQDGIYDGNQVATITLSATGYPSVNTNITVVEGNVPFLTLTLTATNVLEGSNFLASVTRDPVSASPLTVQLNSSDGTQLSVPGTVEIPANVASVNFSLTAVEDTLVERTNNYTVTASASGFISDADVVRIRDNDIPDLTVILDADTISEGAGPTATSGRVVRSFPGGRALTVALVSGNIAAALVPSSIIIPAGATSAVFTVSAVNDAIVDGPQVAAIGAAVLETGSGFVLRQGAPDALTVTDDDGPTLTLVIATDLVGEGLNPATSATVTRNTSTNSQLEVFVASSDIGQATAPSSVMIPAGQISANFNIASVADGVTDGNQTVTFTASAPGFTAGSDTLVVSDADLPDLVVTNLVSTNLAFTGETIDAELVLQNRGLLAFNGTIVQRIFISTDSLLGNDTLGAQISYTGPFPVGDVIEQVASIRMPSNPGNYWLIGQADVNDAVLEALENNNLFITATPIVVEPGYSVTVSADLTQALANTPVPISGQATLRRGGGPAAFVPVTIHLQVRGIRRTFSIVTGADGRFSYTFQPLPNEAGVYQLSAAHPGVSNPATQDTFTLIGMSIAPVGVVNVIEGESVSGSARVENLSDVPLTALTATVVTNQPSLNVVVSINTNTLGAFAVASLDYYITPIDASIFQSPVLLRLTSAEGVVAEVVLTVRVEALRPRLAATPTSLAAAMQRGGQTTVAFDLANRGGVATGPLEVLAPNMPWLSISSPVQMPPLPPGSNTTITILLTPPSDLPLADYNGNLVVQSTNSALSVPFSFRAVSDAKGSLAVVAEDEYTYFASGAPRVTNATVVLTDALSGSPVVTNRTGSDGSILFTNLTEAYYIVDVRAEGHAPFRETALVTGGSTTNVTAFLARETVRYTFTVTPTTVEDRYTFQVDSTFETQVPIPVVTISPASIDLSQYPGDDFQVQLTIANHGLIAAENVQLDIPSTDSLEVTPLIADIGRLAANTSLTVPVRVRRLAAGGGTIAAGTVRQASIHGQCSVTARMLWDYLCGPNVVNRDTAFYMFDSTGCDINALYDQVYTRVPIAQPQFPYGSVPISQAYQDFLDLLQPLIAPLQPPFWRFQCRPTPPPGPSPLGHSATVTRANTAAPGANEVCARVTLRLDQRAVLARDAFRASLEIANDTSDPIQNILVNIEIKDSAGTLVNSFFGIRPPELSGITAVDGTGALGANSSGNANWILIPTLDAAPTNSDVLYLVGGTISYEQAGATISVPLAPAPIQVFPQPELLVRYFHERDVFSDDPFTTAIEPSIPYSLAVQVANVGYGAARSLRLAGGRPQVVDNEKGLLMEFNTIATQLENQSLNPALEVDFGRIEPGSNKVARWIFTSTIQGNFTNFAASFAHLDALGAQRLSLVRSVEIHELTRIIQAGGAFNDGRPDLLVNDVQDADRFPETLYLSDNTTAPVAPVTNVTINGTPAPGSLSITIDAATSAGWNYIRFGNPGGAEYRLTQVRRSDNSIVPLNTNVWTTDRFFRGGELRPIYTNLVHLVDHNSDGAYTLVYVPVAVAADTNPPVSAVAALPTNSAPDITVGWAGDDGTNGSGIAHYSIYVSVNNGAFNPWVTNTPLTAAIYSGVPGNTYRFYSRATDTAGNVEEAPLSADSQTLVISPTNSRPAFAAVEQLSVPEGSLFTHTPSVNDSDVPAQSISFTLLSGAAAGTLFNPSNGRVTWSTTENDGGATNTFRIVATDNGSPSMSATQVVTLRVLEVNAAPVITGAPAQIIIDEQTPASVFLGVNDPDLPAQTHTWQLGFGAPSGLTLDPNTGLLTWTPTETQGPNTNQITVTVRDNGSPMLSDTRVISIVVNEANRAPELTDIADHAGFVLTTLTISAAATDPDVPANRLIYTLDPGAPAGARLTRNGVFTWTPSRAQALSTNPITIRVTDNGLPALSDTTTFNVIVGNYFDVALGSTFVLAGQTGQVDIAVTATLPTTNASFTLDLPVPGLRNLTLPPATPPLASATLQQLTANSYRINLATLAGQSLSGTQVVSRLQFVAATNELSAFVPLQVSDVSAIQSNGQLLPAVGTDGRVIFINGRPLLEFGTNRVQLRLTIYAEPAPSYTLQSAASLMAPVTWSNIWTGPVSNLYEVALPPHTNSARFYRATRP